jgi:hypothetical protein
MTTILQIISAFAFTLLLGCGSQSADSTNNPKSDTQRNTASFIDTPRIFVKNYGVNDTNRLFAFAGEKISVEPLPQAQGSMDNAFKAKYAILKKVYGNFPEDTIEFIAYDHYGTPAFSKFKNALLYVSADSGVYYHQKYMYNGIYKTKDGRWAGTYAGDDYDHAYNRHTKIKPVKIEFARKVSFPTKITDQEGRQHELSYPKPYFNTVGDTAFAVYGNYLEDLFALKKSGILTARGLFAATAQQEEDMVESMQPEPPKTPPTADDLKFLKFWNRFAAALKEPLLKSFRQIALDTLHVCGQLLPANRFIDKCFNEVIDDEVRKRIADISKLEYSYTETEFYNLLTSQVKKEIIKAGDGYRLRNMSVTRSTKNDNPPEIYFEFIETKKGYRLYGIGHHWFKDCCQ